MFKLLKILMGVIQRYESACLFKYFLLVVLATSSLGCFMVVLATSSLGCFMVVLATSSLGCFKMPMAKCKVMLLQQGLCIYVFFKNSGNSFLYEEETAFPLLFATSLVAVMDYFRKCTLYS